MSMGQDAQNIATILVQRGHAAGEQLFVAVCVDRKHSQAEAYQLAGKARSIYMAMTIMAGGAA